MNIRRRTIISLMLMVLGVLLITACVRSAYAGSLRMYDGSEIITKEPSDSEYEERMKKYNATPKVQAPRDLIIEKTKPEKETKLRIGMTKSEVRNVVGWEQPRCPTTITAARGVVERWCQYADWIDGIGSIGLPPYIYFVNGILVMIQD